MVKHVSIAVKGKVQGVFFRASTKEKAIEIGIRGFVKNESDGSVFIEAEGNGSQLSEFIAWCKQGSRLAKVEHCLVEEGIIKGFTGFVILR